MGVKVGNNYLSSETTFNSKNQKSKDVKNDADNKEKFDSVNDLNKYLRENFNIVKNGQAKISSKYLRDSLNDSDKQKKLFENLQAVDNALKSHEGEIGFQGMTISINEDGDMTMTSSKATVTFNESKRARQLAAAKSVSDIRKLLEILKTDLEDCENGLQNNMCDEAEVKKVKKMIERAQSRMNELSATESDENQNNLSIDVLI